MKTFENIHGETRGERVTIHPPEPAAFAVYMAFKEAMEAEATLDKAASDPALNYTGQYDPIDFYGHEEIAFNRAVDHLGAMIRELLVAKPEQSS